MATLAGIVTEALSRLRLAWWALCGRGIIANCHFENGLVLPSGSDPVLILGNTITLT